MGNPWLDSEHARQWVSMAKPGNPLHDDQLAVVRTLLDAHGAARLLDLGCGPGDVTRLLVENRADAALVGLDSSDVMIERAAATLGGREAPTRFVVADVTGDWPALVDGPFDCVTALNVVHHIDADEKRAVFAKVASVLEPGGLFVLVDRVAFDPRLFGFVVALWNHARTSHGYDALPEGYDHVAYLADNAEAGDVPDRVDDQLVWLADAGFDPVDCFWRFANRAVFGGLRK